MNFDIEIDFSRCSHLLWFLLWIIFLRTLLRKTAVSKADLGLYFWLSWKPLTSTKKRLTLVLEACLRNLWPMPRFSCAPSIIPGKSAIDIFIGSFTSLFIGFYSTLLFIFILTFRLSSYSMRPTCGFIVVTFLFISNS